MLKKFFAKKTTSKATTTVESTADYAKRIGLTEDQLWEALYIYDMVKAGAKYE